MFRTSISVLFLLAGAASGQLTLDLSSSPAAQSPQQPPAQAQAVPSQQPTRITLDDAISLALSNSPSLKATRTRLPKTRRRR